MNMNKTSWLDRPIVRGINLNWEQALYILLILLCLVSRLAMLGYRVQSHDESLHTKFSWDLYHNGQYQHSPMMHGPFLFHATALAYFLFGDNDFTARLTVALLGTLLVGFPYLLRRYLGRYGALLASLMLLISPSIFYYSRYIRHDIPVAVWAMFVIWAMVRYLEEGQNRHLYVLAAALSLMYATKEVAAIYTLIVAAFLLVLFAVQTAQRGLPRDQSASFTAGLGSWLRSFRSFDLIVVIGTLCLPFASPLVMTAASRLAERVVAGAASPELAPAFWSNLANLDVLNYTAPHLYYTGAMLGLAILAAVAIGLAWDWRRWLLAAAVHTTIFVVLYTTVFTNGAGIASGWVGSVGYWLAQQEVQRGSQPWFYYLFVLPFYDFLPLLLALVAPIYLAVRALVKRPTAAAGSDKPAAEPRQDTGATLYLAFLLTWIPLAWLGYSYAGEKMPWLTVHLALPMILLGGWLVGRLLEAIDWSTVWQKRGWLLALLLPALVAALLAVVKAAGQGPFQGVELAQLQVTGNLLGGLIGLALLGALVGLLWKRVGLRSGLQLLALTVLLAMVLLTVRIAYRFNFVTFDYPTEFLVYAHESGDVRTAMEQLEELSLRVGGGPELIDVTYGPEGSWPLSWYLRNYPNARFYPANPSREQVLATAIIAGYPDWNQVEPYLGDDYYTFHYVFLWWPMEDYRHLTWQSFWQWLGDPQKRAALWQIFYNRDYTLYGEVTGRPHTLDAWPLHREFRLYVRRDVVAQLWDLGVGPVPEAAPPEADPYAAGWQSLTARQVWGAEGSAPGQFASPHGIAVASDGRVYVADTNNDRIQAFSADGQFIAAWGVRGNCGEALVEPATLCEPWDVAVSADGTVHVADTWAHRIQTFTGDGAFIGQWGRFGQHEMGDLAGHSSFYGPRGIAVAPDGEMYVADTGNKRVQVFDAAGLFVREWGGGGTALGQLDEPVGLDVGADGRVYVADTWNRRVQVLSADGAPLHNWPILGWNNPNVDEKPYLAVDDQGRVYVTDPGHYRVLVFDAQGSYLSSFGQFGFDDSSFALPGGIAVGPDGALYVTDSVNHRVMVFDPPQ